MNPFFNGYETNLIRFKIIFFGNYNGDEIIIEDIVADP
jgi:hypothetical protein